MIYKYRVTPLAGVEIQILMSLLLLWLWVVVVMEVLVVVGGGVGGGHGGDGGGDHFQMANVDYPPNSEPITRKKNGRESQPHVRRHGQFDALRSRSQKHAEINEALFSDASAAPVRDVRNSHVRRQLQVTIYHVQQVQLNPNWKSSQDQERPQHQPAEPNSYH